MGTAKLAQDVSNRGLSMDFTHINEEGRARMVDVTGKADSERVAEARAVVKMQPETLQVIRSGGVKKGDVLAVAQVRCV